MSSGTPFTPAPFFPLTDVVVAEIRAALAKGCNVSVSVTPGIVSDGVVCRGCLFTNLPFGAPPADEPCCDGDGTITRKEGAVVKSWPCPVCSQPKRKDAK